MLGKILFLLSFVSFISCEKDAKDVIESTEKIRNSIGLREFSSLKPDSVFDISIMSEEYIHNLYNKIENHSGKKFYQASFFSNAKGDFIKILYLKNLNDKISIVEEVDRYLKNIDSEIPTSLVVIHNYSNKESIYLIDSFPSRKIQERNKLEVAKALKKGKETNAYLCGTAASEIQKKDYPNLHNLLNQQQFDSLKLQYE